MADYDPEAVHAFPHRLSGAIGNWRLHRWVSSVVVALILGLVVSANAWALSKPPYPVIFVHGIASSLTTWDGLASFLSQGGWIGWRLTFNPAMQADPDSGQPPGPPFRGDYYRFSFSDTCIPLFDMHNCHITFEQQALQLSRVVDAVRMLNESRIIQ